MSLEKEDCSEERKKIWRDFWISLAKTTLIPVLVIAGIVAIASVGIEMWHNEQMAQIEADYDARVKELAEQQKAHLDQLRAKSLAEQQKNRALFKQPDD